MGHQTEPTFSALANELIVNIAGFAKLRDVLSLRQTCRKMANNCKRAMKERNSTLYIHPLRVQDAIKICHLEAFRNSITEVALLGKSTRTLRPHDFSEGFDNFHLWPLSEEMGDLHQFHLEDPLAYSKQHHPRKWMPTCYAGLLSALGGLPGLTTLSYGSKAIQEGLCSSSQTTIDAHAWETDPWHFWHADTLGQSGPKSGVDFLRFWTDSELFVGILAARCTPFATVVLHQSLPERPSVRWTRLHDRWTTKAHGQRGFRGDHEKGTFRESRMKLSNLSDDDYNEATVAMGRGVTRFSIVLPEGDVTSGDDDEPVSLLQELVARLPDLETLEVQVDTGVDQHHRLLVSQSNDEVQRSRFERVQRWAFCMFIFDLSYGDCQLYSLQRLRLTCPSVLPACIDSSNTCLCLRAYKSTLREVSFSNVFFADIEGPHEDRIGTGMRKVIEAFGEIVNLELARLYVARVENMHQSELRDGWSFEDCTKCYRSSDDEFESKWFDVHGFDKLAEDLDVALEGAGWNFAKHVILQGPKPLQD